MQVMTVRGPIPSDELGITLPHEHLLADLSVAYWTEPKQVRQKKVAHMPLDMDTLGIARKNQMLLKDVLILDDIELAIEELTLYKMAGYQYEIV